MKISVCTTAYNGYGRFLQRFIENAQAQTYPAHEIIIVLGHDHGLKEIPDGVKFIYHDEPATMGFLKNLALDVATGDYIFFFAADDILLENALQDISEIDADIIALRYNLGNRLEGAPEIVAEKLPNWRSHYTGASGYMAFKKGIRHDDTDYANYALLFQAYAKGWTFKRTKESGAIYLQRPDGRGQQPENHIKGFKEIEKYLLKYGLISVDE